MTLYARFITGCHQDPLVIPSVKKTSKMKTTFVTENLSCPTTTDAGETGSCVVASPGTSFKREWGKLFKGADLVICFDHDKAGVIAAQKVAGICEPYTNSIRIS